MGRDRVHFWGYSRDVRFRDQIFKGGRAEQVEGKERLTAGLVARLLIVAGMLQGKQDTCYQGRETCRCAAKGVMRWACFPKR